MDIKEKISDIVEQIKKNPNLKEDFEKEPVKVIEKLIGVDHRWSKSEINSRKHCRCSR